VVVRGVVLRIGETLDGAEELPDEVDQADDDDGESPGVVVRVAPGAPAVVPDIGLPSEFREPNADGDAGCGCENEEYPDE
jgi:hypothetical protein